MKLRIDLQEGFFDDDVAVLVNGRIVLDKEKVSTSLMLGLAATAETSVDDGENNIEVSVSSRGLRKNISVQVTDTVLLGISLRGDSIQYILAEKPFEYG